MKKKAPSTSETSQASLLAALANPEYYPYPVTSVEKLETHISHILLAGDYAYKIKKPLNLGFLDFTSLEQRKYYCHQELRLNRRLAPELYLDCIPICGSPENPVLDGDPPTAIEYAVKMLRFPQDALLSRCLKNNQVKPYHITDLARALAEFHGRVARADPANPLGSPEQIQRPALDNFQDCRKLLSDPEDLQKLATLKQWTVSTYAKLYEKLAERKTNGFVRECHGDLHLGNMILRADQIVIFDCIEFNEELRWIDIMSDLAFLYMDLCRSGAVGFAQSLLNTYLEFSGDYAGLTVFTYYLVYRAMVRAKIAAIRLNQTDLAARERKAVQAEVRHYLDLALELSHRPPPFLLITHGVSGSGKSYWTGHLLQTLSAIRVRSDVERKRLFGLGPLDSSDSALNQGIYTTEAGARTYERLHQLAGQILNAGYPVLVDATFLEPQQRQAFRNLAEQRQAPFVLLACRAQTEVLRARVAHRHASGSDAAEADLAVLEKQLTHYTPPAKQEQPLAMEDGDIESITQAILVRLRRALPKKFAAE